MVRSEVDFVLNDIELLVARFQVIILSIIKMLESVLLLEEKKLNQIQYD
jgi:hypothetical protein